MKMFLDDIREPHHIYLSNGGEWTVVRTVEEAKELLNTGKVSVASLDHDLGDGPTGYDLVKWMAEYNIWPTEQVLVHSANPVGAANMRSTIQRYFPKANK